MTYTKIQKSRYSSLLTDLKATKQLFVDQAFPPNQQSIGSAPSRNKQIVWKRVRDFVTGPVFFDESIDSPDTPIGNNNDSYLLPAVTALYQRSTENLLQLFATLDVSQQGIYMMRVNSMGVPQEIVVDDLFPVYEDTNKAVFAKPRQGTEIWEMVLEKVWAKLKGSYSNIQAGRPHEVMTTFCNAPCFFLDLNTEDEQFVWLQLQDACHSRFPVVASSKRNVPFNVAIRPLQTYSIVGSYELRAFGQVVGRVVRLGCPVETQLFEGEYHPKNREFWNQISVPAKRAMDFEQIEQNNQFFMSLEQFRGYFDSINVCHLRPTYNYNFERGSSPTGSVFFEVDVEHDGEVYFTLHQKLLKASSNMTIYGRMTVLIARLVGADYQYVAAKMEVNFPSVSLRCPNLPKGRYVVYTKCYRKSEGGEISTVLAVYSQQRVYVKRRVKQLCESFFQRVFLNHAYANPDKTYLDASKRDWVCIKMLYNEGGFGYIVGYVDPPTNKKIRIEFNSRNFEEGGFKIKEPYNYVGTGRIIAEAGRPCVLVCRLQHHVPSKLVFPPEIAIEQTI